MSIKCHEFFGCPRKKECPFHSYEGESYCWEVEVSLTPFVNTSKEINQEEKSNYCKSCIYFQYVNDKKKVAGFSF